MAILSKKQKPENIGATPGIKELSDNVLANRKRVEEQKAAILQKIDELKKELKAPAKIQDGHIESFSIEDIEASATPNVSRSEIARKIVALTNASELKIYSDNGYMNSVYEYLTAIRPRVEQIDKEQWELVSLKKQIVKERNDKMEAMWNSYAKLDKELKELLKVADVSYPKSYGYNKHRVEKGTTWFNEVNDVTHLIDSLLDVEKRDIYDRIK